MLVDDIIHLFWPSWRIKCGLPKTQTFFNQTYIMQFITAFFNTLILQPACQIRQRKIRHNDEATVADLDTFGILWASWS